MRPGVTIALSVVDRRRLEAIVGNRNASQKHAWRAEIVLLSAGGLGTVEIIHRTGQDLRLWRWRERFAEEGVDGLLRDKTRPSRVAPLGQEVIDRVVALTATEPPHEATHWTGAAMAEAAGISVSSVQRIWKAHGLAPHRVRRFVFHFTPTSCSWLNAVETFFATLTKRRLKRGVFRSVVDLQAAINRYLDEANHNPKPFLWTAHPDKIIAAVNRGRQALESIH